MQKEFSNRAKATTAAATTVVFTVMSFRNDHQPHDHIYYPMQQVAELGTVAITTSSAPPQSHLFRS